MLWSSTTRTKAVKLHPLPCTRFNLPLFQVWIYDAFTILNCLLMISSAYNSDIHEYTRFERRQLCRNNFFCAEPLILNPNEDDECRKSKEVWVVQYCEYAHCWSGSSDNLFDWRQRCGFLGGKKVCVFECLSVFVCVVYVRNIIERDKWVGYNFINLNYRDVFVTSDLLDKRSPWFCENDYIWFKALRKSSKFNCS